MVSRWPCAARRRTANISPSRVPSRGKHASASSLSAARRRMCIAPPSGSAVQAARIRVRRSGCACQVPCIAPSLAPMLSRIFPDPLVPLLLATFCLPSLLPGGGEAVPLAEGVSTAAIVLLFFLNGVRLPRDEVLHGIRNWKLQGANLAFCFAAMPLLG